MGVFDMFKKKERTKIPLVYYRGLEVEGREADEEEFSFDYARNVILFAQRMHEVGTLAEEEVVSFSIPKILSQVQSWGLLPKIKPPSLVDTVTILFGADYINRCVRDMEGGVCLLPPQLVFYHSAKDRNYYLSLVGESLDWKENTIDESELENRAEIIRKSRGPKFGLKDTAELQTAFYILFSFLKYMTMTSAKQKGYDKPIQVLDSLFEGGGFYEHLNQYFALNTEKKNDYPEAYRAKSFTDLAEQLLRRKTTVLNLEGSSFESLIRGAGDLYVSGSEVYENRFALIEDLQRQAERRGESLWIWKKEKFSTSTLFLCEKKGREGLAEGPEVLCPFSSDLKRSYREELLEETRIRRLAGELYPLLGVRDMQEAMLKITGEELLDPYLYKNDFLAEFDWDEDIHYSLYHLLDKRGLADLLEDSVIDDRTLDDRVLDEDEGASVCDRVSVYADLIRERGSLLFSVDDGEELFIFGLIEEPDRKRFVELMEEAEKTGEIEGYRLFY
ncbi:MAG: hypothetical protein Q3993_08510 [Filifactor alocis]|nr:hypothetical protein [Filifactor alocis]